MTVREVILAGITEGLQLFLAGDVRAAQERIEQMITEVEAQNGS